jgi:putative membrane protein
MKILPINIGSSSHELKGAIVMKTYKKILAGVLAAAVSAGATGSIAYAKNLGKEEAASQMKEKAQAGASAERTASSAAACKDETVYVLCNTDSSVKNVVVSDWLKNAKAAGTLSDISTLSDIVNVKGDEIFAQSGDELDWSAQGNDIYYKGTTDKELPVDVTISYFLDGKEVSPKEITGKSGHLTIRWSYTNKQKSTATINGKKTGHLRSLYGRKRCRAGHRKIPQRGGQKRQGDL